MFSAKFLNSESSSAIANLRSESNYIFTRTLAKVIYYIVVIFSIITILTSPFLLLVGLGNNLKEVLISISVGVLLFLVAKLIYESFSVILDIGDATVASVPKDNQNEFPSDPLMLSGVVDELKKISEQNEKQTEALKTSIEELSEKTDKTNAYLHHIYQNSTKAPPPPSS